MDPIKEISTSLSLSKCAQSGRIRVYDEEAYEIGLIIKDEWGEAPVLIPDPTYNLDEYHLTELASIIRQLKKLSKHHR